MALKRDISSIDFRFLANCPFSLIEAGGLGCASPVCNLRLNGKLCYLFLRLLLGLLLAF